LLKGRNAEASAKVKRGRGNEGKNSVMGGDQKGEGVQERSLFLQGGVLQRCWIREEGKKKSFIKKGHFCLEEKTHSWLGKVKISGHPESGRVANSKRTRRA